MRPIGAAKADSSVSGEMDGDTSNVPDSRDVGRGEGVGGRGRESVEIVVDDNYYGDVYGEGGARVSTECFARLSPTTIVYISAFVSSLTSVLLGYGEHLKH